jgi:trans-AT polyketide synthase/acyltransferase/oxidoreductase domain-containing protein
MTAFLFPGQGAQYKGMGWDLFPQYPALTRQASDVLGYSIEQLCVENPHKKLRLTEYTQPALYVVGVLRYMKMRDEGSGAFRPTYLLGHSLGEYNALWVAGVFDFETGLRLVRKRGEIMGAARGGTMAAVLGMNERAVRTLLTDHGLGDVDLANFNAPTQFVISGPSDSVGKVMQLCAQRGVNCVPLNVAAPFHSRYMAAAQAEFAVFLRGFSFADPQIPVVANFTALPYEPGTVADLLSRQIASPVRWSDSLRYLLKQKVGDFVEVGSTFLMKMMQEIQYSESSGTATMPT